MRERRESTEDEQGAVAIVVAISLVVLLGLSAFAVDFGVAYSSTRQLQTAVDSAAVAAASAYAEEVGDCQAILAAGTAVGVDAGEDVHEQNHDSVDYLAQDIRCEDSDGNGTQDELRVTWTTRTTTPTVFGPVLPGNFQELSSTRTADTILGIPGSYGEGLRPVMLCSEDSPSPTEDMPTTIRQTSSSNSGASENPLCPEPPGNWWTIDCPEANANLKTEIEEGCERPIAPSSTPYTFADCPPTADPVDPARCLSGDTGALSGTKDAWKALIDGEVEFQIPVFGTTQGNGTTAEFTILAVVTVQMCGYHLGNQRYPSTLPTTGLCSASNMPSPALPDITSVPGSQRYFFYLVYTRVNYTNTVRPSDCRLGDPCDIGARSVFLVG